MANIYYVLKRFDILILVFSAIRINSIIGSQSQLPIDLITIESVSGFDNSKKIYAVKSSDFYLIHMSAGVPTYQRLLYTLQNASSTPNILLTHTEYDGESVTSSHDKKFFNEDQKLYISSAYPLYSDELCQTKRSGFKLDDVMSSLILFSVARTTFYYTVNSFVPFENLLMNEGQAWDTCNYKFIVPHAGVCFFSMFCFIT